MLIRPSFKSLLTLMGVAFLFLGACSKPLPPQPPGGPSPEITADGEEGGFVDLGFAIRSRETLPDGSQALHAYGVPCGREVGLTVVLGSQWKSGALGPIVAYRGTVTFRSLGAPSDALLQVLDQ